MAYFWRRGHYRTSKYGRAYWVDEHSVTRNAWPTGSGQAGASTGLFKNYPEVRGGTRFTACFIAPNARCPVCGDHVYYYQNERGSRVYFDEIGPPWPKHPCTNNGTTMDRLTERDPQARARKGMDEIGFDLVFSKNDPARSFQTKYRCRPLPLAEIVMRAMRNGRVFVVLEVLDPAKPRKVFLSCRSLPKNCKEGFCVAIGRRTLSHFCVSTMDGKEVETQRYRNAAAFVDAMTSQDEKED